MSKTVDGTATDGRAVPEGSDRRLDQLENVSLAAKAYIPASDSEIDCIVTRLSAEGASIATPLASSIGSEIALYIDGFDRFTASVRQTSQESLEVRFNSSPAKRERTAARIRSFLEGGQSPVESRSESEGTTLQSLRQFKRKNGETAKFDVVDISLTGATLKTRSRPPIGEIVTIGTVEGEVTRHFDEGIAVEFARRPKSRLRSAR